MGILRYDTKGRVLGPSGWALDRLCGKKERRKFGRCPSCGGKDLELWWGARLKPTGKGVYREEFRLEVFCHCCLAHSVDRN